MEEKNLDLDFYGIELGAMDISFKNMYYYVIAAETGNITQAARRLYVTQSALSKTILSCAYPVLWAQRPMASHRPLGFLPVFQSMGRIFIHTQRYFRVFMKTFY